MGTTLTKKEQAQLDALESMQKLSRPVIITQDRRMLDAIRQDAQAAEVMDSMGVGAEALDAHERWLDHLERGEGRWELTVQRDEGHGYRDAISQGYDILAEGLAPARFHFRHDSRALSLLDAIREGEGHDDMASDLESMRQFYEQHEDAFAHDATP